MGCGSSTRNAVLSLPPSTPPSLQPDSSSLPAPSPPLSLRISLSVSLTRARALSLLSVSQVHVQEPRADESHISPSFPRDMHEPVHDVTHTTTREVVIESECAPSGRARKSLPARAPVSIAEQVGGREWGGEGGRVCVGFDITPVECDIIQ
jgi:hypothetical protein